MKIRAKCKICGTEYWKKNGKAMYCSDECKKTATRNRQKKWREEHSGYMKKWRETHPGYDKEWYESHTHYGRDRSREIRGSKEYNRECIVCGKSFKTWLPHKKTCSDECSKFHITNRKREIAPEKEHAKWIKRRYGSEEAHQQYLAELEQKKQEQKEQTRKRREAEKQARIIHGKCVVCGNTFETFNPAQKTCCKVCGKKLQYARNDHRIPKNQIIDKDITLEALYRRDSGVCYLCWEPCDWNDKNHNVVGANYPSIDHIIPVSRGGFHAWNNVRLAHFGCNLLKSDTLLPDVEQIIPKNAYSEKRELAVRRKQTFQYS